MQQALQAIEVEPVSFVLLTVLVLKVVSLLASIYVCGNPKLQGTSAVKWDAGWSAVHVIWCCRLAARAGGVVSHASQQWNCIFSGYY
jgi:hypothetical protein